MSQPLVFKVMKDDDQIAVLYFHWSAEVGIVYSTAKMLIDGMKARNFTPEMSKEETIVMLLDILEAIRFEMHLADEEEPRVLTGGAGREDAELLEEMSQRVRKKGLADFKHVSRSEGIIYISDEWMSECEEDACAIELFDVTNGYFTNTCFCDYSAEELFEYELMRPEELERAKGTNIPKFDATYAFGHPVLFEDADKACEWAEKVVSDAETHYGIAGIFVQDDIPYYVVL